MGKRVSTKGAGETLWLTGDNWEALQFPAGGINPPGLPSDPNRDPDDGCFLFDRIIENTVTGQAQLPMSWKKGSAIQPHIHWSPTDDSSGVVMWEFKCQFAAVGYIFGDDWIVQILPVTVADEQDKHILSRFVTDIAFCMPTTSSIVKWRLSRLATNPGDTYGADAKLLALDFHYQMDSLGCGDPFCKI